MFKSGETRILVTTEALTMTLEAWIQRAGRGARSLGIKCLCIMIVTKKMVEAACKACKDASIPVDPALASIKAEEVEEAEDEVLPDGQEDELVPQGVSGTLSLVVKGLNTLKKHQRVVDVGVSQYIATNGCRTAVLDRAFSNPPHPTCYEVGGCDHCVEQHRKNEDSDLHAAQRQSLKQEIEEQNVTDFVETAERKKPTYRQDETKRYGPLRTKFVEALTAWRKRKFLELIELYDTDLDSIMTDKELNAIAKTRGVVDISAFDQTETRWPVVSEWRQEVLGVLEATQQEEDKQVARQEQQKREKEEQREQQKREKEEQREQQKREKEEQREQQRKEQRAEKE
ncbi:hypothetical protein FRC10_000371 [Ceratobasidium sp. 414]|nr:hypothetical protein FRC10_000371 [Ceratobasidium sp. 414]